MNEPLSTVDQVALWLMLGALVFLVVSTLIRVLCDQGNVKPNDRSKE